MVNIVNDSVWIFFLALMPKLYDNAQMDTEL